MLFHFLILLKYSISILFYNYLFLSYLMEISLPSLSISANSIYKFQLALFYLFYLPIYSLLNDLKILYLLFFYDHLMNLIFSLFLNSIQILLIIQTMNVLISIIYLLITYLAVILCYELIFNILDTRSLAALEKNNYPFG